MVRCVRSPFTTSTATHPHTGKMPLLNICVVSRQVLEDINLIFLSCILNLILQGSVSQNSYLGHGFHIMSKIGKLFGYFRNIIFLITYNEN